MSQPLPPWTVALTIFVMTGIFGLSVSVWHQAGRNRQPPTRTSNAFAILDRPARPHLPRAIKPAVEPPLRVVELVQPEQNIDAVDEPLELAPPAQNAVEIDRRATSELPSLHQTWTWLRTTTTQWLADCQAAAKSAAQNASYQRPSTAPNHPVPPPSPSPRSEIEPLPTWPRAESLLNQLAAFERDSTAPAWTTKVREALGEISQLGSLHDERVVPPLDRLGQIAEQIARDANNGIQTQQDDPQYSRWSRMGYELSRRVDVWREVHRLAKARLTHIPMADSPHQTVAFSRWNFSQIDGSWREYLGLDQLSAGPKQSTSAARLVLARFHSILMNPAQQAAVEQWIGPEQFQRLRDAAASPTELSQLLRDVEAFHDQRTGYTEAQLNDHYQDLLWCGEKDARGLIQALEDHYRNANVRIAISETTLNRLLAGSHSFQEPVRDQILGASVSGRSQVTNQLSVELVPDRDRWSLVLTTQGNVRSRTQAQRDGFVIHSMGSADVVGSKRIHLSNSQVTSEAPLVEAVTDNQVIGLDSPYDDIPLIGCTARRIAHRKQLSSEGEVDQIVRSRIRARVQERMEQAVTEALQKAQSEFNRWVTARFLRWGLEPQPIEMSTSETELVVRYRLAGFDHLAATTPRPTISGDTAVSLQLHESAVNNVLSRLDLGGQSFNLDSLITHLESKLQTSFGKREPAEHRVDLEFAPYDPVRIEFDGEFIHVALHLRELTIGRGKTWKKITLRTKYAVEFDGFYLTLKQVDGVGASGGQLRVRDEMAIAAIVDKLLKDEYRFSLLPTSYEKQFAEFGIVLSEVGLVDGWLSVIYRNARPDHETAIPRKSSTIRR